MFLMSYPRRHGQLVVKCCAQEHKRTSRDSNARPFGRESDSLPHRHRVKNKVVSVTLLRLRSVFTSLFTSNSTYLVQRMRRLECGASCCVFGFKLSVELTWPDQNVSFASNSDSAIHSDSEKTDSSEHDTTRAKRRYASLFSRCS